MEGDIERERAYQNEIFPGESGGTLIGMDLITLFGNELFLDYL